MEHAEARRVVSYEAGCWVVSSAGSQRASFRSDDRADAVARASRIVRNAGGGEVEIRSREGRLDRVVTVPVRRRIGRSDLRVR